VTTLLRGKRKEKGSILRKDLLEQSLNKFLAGGGRGRVGRSHPLVWKVSTASSIPFTRKAWVYGKREETGQGRRRVQGGKAI